jgi:microcystin-dependent protein
MADWSLPALTSTYTNFLAEVKNRDVDLALQFDGTTSTSVPTGAIRWSSSANRWQKWSGSAWGELATTYALTGLSTTGAASIGTTLTVTSTTTLTGGGTSTTPVTDNNTTNIATTAFVVGQASATAPVMDGTAAVGTSLRYARQDHRHPIDTTRAPLASPTFTGTVTIPAGASISGYAPLASPTFTGTVTIPAGASISGYLTAATAASTYAPIANGVPAGAINYFAMSTAPTGYLKANGAAVSRTTYAALFSAIGTTYGAGDGSTTFTLPDLRGEFVRGWADGRAVDTGRALGSFQNQDYQSHNHGVTDPSHRHDVYYDINQGGDPNSSYAFNGISAYANRASSYSFTGISIQNNGGTETRPRNIALLACIKF